MSEVLPTFSRKPLFGYHAFVWATIGIGLLSFSVWAHHMFTTGVVFLPFFTFMTALIAIPTGVKMFNWLATLWRGSLVFTTAMLFGLGIVSMFLIGGISGVMLASAPVDFHLQDTYFVVAHLHYVFFGGAAMGVFAATYYWFPKMCGRLLNETLGKIHFAMLFVGFNAAFFVQHMLGIQGMPRRVADYAADAGWTEMNPISTLGAFLIAASMVPFVVNVVTSLMNGPKAGDDPWEGNTLEWATTSPPPTYNFDSLPPIRSERPVFDLRHRDDPVFHPELGPPPRGRDGRTDERARACCLGTGPPPGWLPDPAGRDAAVHLLGGDVLRRPVRHLLQRAGLVRRGVGPPRPALRSWKSFPLPVPITIILLTSSLTMHFGVRAIAAGQVNRLRLLAGGDPRPGHPVPDRPGHRLHPARLWHLRRRVRDGVLHPHRVPRRARVRRRRGTAILTAGAGAGQFSARNHVAVEAVSYYWHFVDVVWIALFTTLYILR